MINYVLKRDGSTKVQYDRIKIKLAIQNANRDVEKKDRIPTEDIKLIVKEIENEISDKESVSVEEIQDLVEKSLMKLKYFNLAKSYITYRYERALVRRANTTDESILGLLRNTNDDVSRENSNKKSILNSTKRDLVAGEVSKDLSRRILLPEKIIREHDLGHIHFHDMDYFMQPEFNCCLPNFEDMLENGTAINGVKVETPKSFRVACTQITQCLAAISSSQYGGQTFYSSVLGKYLAYTREKYRKKMEKRYQDKFSNLGKELIEKLIESELSEKMQEELEAGVQTIQYQINTLMTTNGMRD